MANIKPVEAEKTALTGSFFQVRLKEIDFLRLGYYVNMQEEDMALLNYAKEKKKGRKTKFVSENIQNKKLETT